VTPDSPEEWFHETATRFVAAQALFHLNDCGVIAALAAGPASAEDLAARLSLEPRVLAGLLDYVSRVDPVIGRDAGGRFALTDFGRRVLERYGRRDGDRVEYNFFDVRVGGYGPVWAALGGMLRGRARYGREVVRAGDGAARGLYRSAAGLLPALRAAADAARAEAVAEIGVDDGLLARLAAERPGLDAVGVDLSAEALDAARAAAGGGERPRWTRGDFFAPEGWAGAPAAGRLLVFTLHLHELAAAGTDRVRAALAALGRARPGTVFAAFEQPLLPDSARETLPPARWLYAQSNVLIHELVGKGRILPEAEWLGLLGAAGGTVRPPADAGFLGYRTYAVELGA
jgi:hypothetical protein